jgi:hypothetical protein
MVVMFTVVPPALEAGALDAAALLPPAAGAVVAGVLEDELAELAHADNARATAASPAAPNIFRIRNLLFTVLMISHGDHVPASRSVHVQVSWARAAADRTGRGSPARGGGEPPARRRLPLSVVMSPDWRHGW